MKSESMFLPQKQALDTALDSGGAEITCQTHGHAVRFRQGCYELRKLVRERLAPKPSAYDMLTLPRLDPGSLVVRILVNSTEDIKIKGAGKKAVAEAPSAPLAEDDPLLDLALDIKKGLK